MAYTTIDDPSQFFQVVTWTGSSGTDTITFGGNSDLQLDFLWTKSRSNAHSHALMDTQRITSGDYLPLFADTNDQEQTFYDSELQSITSDGFTVGTQPHAGGDGKTYVGWAWKANGGTTSSNSSGTNITSTVQANTTAGFSIVTFTGTGNDGDSYGHGLTSAPELVIPKRRDSTSNWQGYAFDGGNSQYWYLNLTNAFANTTGNSAASSSSVITTDASGDSNPSGGTVVSYCFHSVQGYSKIGRYTGNGNANGPFIYLGFKPAWVIVKRTNTTGAWEIYDSARNGNDSNPINDRLRANSDAVENADDTSDYVSDFLSNGWKIRTNSGNWNTNGHTYIYMAFAEHPFVSSKGVPVTAR